MMRSAGSSARVPAIFPGESGQRLAMMERFQQQYRAGILTLLYTDLVDYTHLKQELGDTGFSASQAE
jgi:hypothetical protein